MNVRKLVMTWDEGVFGLRAAGIMLDGKNRVLLCKVADDPKLDFWVLPGGGSNLHEPSIETVKREFLEEANFEVEVQRLLWIEENYFHFEGKRVHGVGFYFLVTPKEANGVWEKEEFMGKEDDISHHREWKLLFKWFDISKLNDLELYPKHFKDALMNIPDHPVHVIHYDYDGE